MDLEITGRGTQVTHTLRQQAEEGLARIEKVLGPKCMGKVVLLCEKNRCEAEVTVRNTISDFSSHTSAKEIEVALKDALDKVESQAVKARKKVVTTRHHPEHTATGSIRLQSEDVDIKDQTDPESKRLSQSKTAVGKAIAGIDDGELHEEQDIEAA
ncbi:MAG: HPF/RaiA family ribosome-associated protein [Janthinobacterium lividum]